MPQDPAAIQRQIENTRAELAETIDAIADKVSPKRVADRTKVALQDKATELRSRVQQSRNGHGPAALLPGGSGDGQQPALYRVERSIRWDRVAIAGGAVLLLLLRRHGKAKRRPALPAGDS